MSFQRKYHNSFLISSFILLIFLPSITFSAPIIDHWPVIHSAFFSDRLVKESADELIINAPIQAENAALVPFSFELVNTNKTFKFIYLFVDANPITHTATLHLPPNTSQFKLSTRIRLENNSYVRVIAETESGQLYMRKVAIKTPGGGCGGGALSDEAALRASAGKIKFQQISDINHPLKIATIHIKHPMRTGFERTAMGYYAKAWFINHIDFIVNDAYMMRADLGPGISADPYFQFNYQADSSRANSIVKIQVKDNERQVHQSEFMLNKEILN